MGMNGAMKRMLAILLTAALALILPTGLAETAGYAFDAEEIMYLAGVAATVGQENVRYSLYDVDGDGVSELFIDDGGEVRAYRYDAGSNAPVGADLDYDGADLNWVGSDQWVDSSIVGVAARAGDPGPENDYYLSSNYDWLSEEQVKAQGEIVTGQDGLDERVAANKASLLDEREKYSGEDVRRVWDYYDAATNWDRRDGEGVEPARRYVEAAQSPASLDELTAFITDPDADPFCRMLSITVSLEEKDTSHWAAVLEEDEFSVLPRIYHNGEPEDIEAARWDFDVKARHMLGRLGYDEETVDGILSGCYQVEDRLLAVAWPDEDEEPGPLDGFVPFETAAKACERFPLEAVLNACGMRGGRVNVCFPKYIEELDALYTEDNLDILKAYLTAHIAADACELLDHEAATCLDAATDGVARTREELNASYRTETLSSRGPVNVALLNAYMTAFVDPATREDLIALCEKIRDTFRAILEGEDWLSEAGRAAAVRKLDNMAFSVMAPNELIDSAYQAVDPDVSFLDNCASLRVNALRHNAAFVGEERVKGDWRYDLRSEIATTDVNAFYYGCFNQFFILSGFVSDDVYRPDMPMEEKLALMGEIIGHELTHGFDPTGIQYDENGNKAADDSPCGWLPEADYEAFMQRANRIAEYFDAIWAFPYGACPGELQWGEAAADIGGLTIGLAIAQQTPGFDYDRYFRAHSTLWRKQDTLVAERGDLYNEHPLSHLRINVTVQQFDEFMETYGVREGDGMYLAPEDRIRIW